MQKLYTSSAIDGLIDRYIKAGGKMHQIDEGVLGHGFLMLYDERDKLKTFIIREIYINHWQSEHTVRAYNKMPKKYMRYAQ